MLICKECGKERSVGRRLCTACNSKRVTSYGRYTWKKVCIACDELYDAWRKDQDLCRECNLEKNRLKSLNKATNTYIFSTKIGRTEHRDIVESILGRKLHTNEVIHHLDDNTKNNELTNLIVLSRGKHASLHSFLDLQRVILEKSGIENIENCWKTLIVPTTTTWLETANVKVIKMWEIGQSASEPLKEKSNEEGSETKHDDPVTDKAVGYDIVQTLNNF
jgi:hypothetical protein